MAPRHISTTSNLRRFASRRVRGRTAARRDGRCDSLVRLSTSAIDPSLSQNRKSCPRVRYLGNRELDDGRDLILLLRRHPQVRHGNGDRIIGGRRKCGFDLRAFDADLPIQNRSAARAAGRT